ncbi:gamma-glutamylcyclotransferase [Maritalea porphyrae]|uniref:gamma-glutamylcyclotransferase n=1 Tax=Maritalea porphyrae TaxID=880732 RepID=UPI0022AF3BA3|nr:gamma-glutamylcyclotransferase [Maritalea porphyrae]MCZ4273980.1 gamma-glutamylcyclotransferase [Maritalea porphyrae]
MSYWVFGYGSLIWRPGFDYVQAQQGLVRGLHRQLCVYSFTHRGTEEHPGLVFGLDQGGACRGMAFEVEPGIWDETHAYLREREQGNNVYKESWRKIALADGQVVEALTFVADRTHRQYAGRLPREEQLRLVRQGVGHSGENPEYVINTYAHLAEMNIKDDALKWLHDALMKGDEAALS